MEDNNKKSLADSLRVREGKTFSTKKPDHEAQQSQRKRDGKIEAKRFDQRKAYPGKPNPF